MRPEAPPIFKPTVIERLGLQRLLTQTPRMVMRQLERRPWKTAMSVLGIALATSVLVLGNFSVDAIDFLIEFQFYRSQRQDMTIAFVEPREPRVLHEVGQMSGVMSVESFRSVPVRMRHGHRSRRVGIVGLQRDSQLMRVLDRDGRAVTMPPDGLVLSQKLAEVLRLGVGDDVVVEVQEGQRPTRTIPVVALINDFAGMNAYMDEGAVRHLMREGQLVSGVYISVDDGQLDALYAEIKQTPGIASVAAKEASIESFRKTIAENQLMMQGFLVLFASVIAFGVVYNTARISLSERSRELATLRVVGFTRVEISAILLGELAVLTLLGIPVGLLLGYGFAGLVAAGADTEMYRIPLVVSTHTLGFAAGVTLAAAVISGLIVRRKLDRLDLVAVLKSRE
jgi:putative ABC transport system permease protein